MRRRCSGQLRSLLLEVMRHGQRILVGGDFNTTTYDASSKLAGACARPLLVCEKGFDTDRFGLHDAEFGYGNHFYASRRAALPTLA